MHITNILVKHNKQTGKGSKLMDHTIISEEEYNEEIQNMIDKKVTTKSCIPSLNFEEPFTPLRPSTNLRMEECSVRNINEDLMEDEDWEWLRSDSIFVFKPLFGWNSERF